MRLTIPIAALLVGCAVGTQSSHLEDDAAVDTRLADSGVMMDVAARDARDHDITGDGGDAVIDARTDAAPDSSVSPDTSVIDGSVDTHRPDAHVPDASVVIDTGVAVDTGVVIDAGLVIDAGTAVHDSGVSTTPDDSGVPPPDSAAPDSGRACLPDRVSRCSPLDPAACCSGRCNPEGFCGPDCLADTRGCSSPSQCCSLECNAGGTCGPRECGAEGDRCFRHDECCGNVCTSGYCGTTPPAVCRGVHTPCWAHSQCCTNTCSPLGQCVNPTCDELHRTAGGGWSCLTDDICCSGVCHFNQCEPPMGGFWLP